MSDSTEALVEDPQDEVLDSSVEEIVENSPDGESDDAPETPAARERGPDGKFVAKVAAPEGEATEGEAEAAEAAPATSSEPARPSGRPVQLKADGQLYDLPGAIQRDDGVVELDQAGFDVVHRYVGQAIVSQKKIQRLQHELEQARQQTTAEAEYVRALGEQYATLAQLDPEDMVAALIEFRQQLPALQARMEAEHWKRQAEHVQRASQPDPRQQEAQYEQLFWHSFDEAFVEFAQAPWAKGLSPDDLNQIKAELEGVAPAFRVIAQQDDRENDIRRGEWLFHQPKLEAQVQKRAQYVANLRREQAKVAASAQRNAVKKQAVVAPPMAGAKTVTTTTSTPTEKPKSFADWQKQNLR